jgi:hypothetical protein
MGYLVHTSLIRQAKWICKIVVILTLSILLLAPEPVLALNFNGTLQSYISNSKLELDGVVSLIKKLPSQSYETGQTMLTEIGTKLQNIETEAGRNAKYFQNQSDEADKTYRNILDRINKLNQEDNYQPIDKTVNVITSVLNKEENEFIYNQMINYCEDKTKQKPVRYSDFYGCGLEFIKSHLARNEDFNTVWKNLLPPMRDYHLIVLLYEESTKHCETKGMKISEVSTPELVACAVPYLVSISKGSVSYQGKKYYIFTEPIGSFFVQERDMYRAIEAYHIMKSLKVLSIQEKNLAKTIVLTNKISKFSDNLQKRVKLAKQKSGNVKEYADALKSFSDPDILGEISELNTLIAGLSQNFPLN